MNPVQMRQHRTVTERLSDRLDVLEPLVDRMMHNGDALYQGHEANAKAIGEERTHRLAMAQEQRGYVDNEDRQLRQCCQERWDSTSAATKRIGDRHQAFVSQTFWQRLRWLVFGG